MVHNHVSFGVIQLNRLVRGVWLHLQANAPANERATPADACHRLLQWNQEKLWEYVFCWWMIILW